MTDDNPSTRLRPEMKLALTAIRISSLADFESSLNWGQWCRAIAIAADDGDMDAVVHMAAQIKNVSVRTALDCVRSATGERT